MPKRVDYEERKDQIIEAMFRIIYQHGFEKTTLREIAKEAGLSLGSVQHIFPKQQDIYIFAMDVIYYRFQQRMEEAAQADKGGFEYAVGMIKQIVQVNSEEERIENDIWLKFSIMATMNPAYQGTKTAFRDVNYNFAKKILRELSERGFANPFNDIEESARSLTIFMHGLVFESVIYPDLYHDQVIEDEIRKYLKNMSR
ncbi:TetR family transcriptional regulator [Salsuginibacillus halophilus]|uniref:TetR family transcriptional regulator n=1 Tax=Salsuginibacillus halophilus TaxID=517424 RepID=A0A2P8H863_9BACI|nr:TetR/AcrR family transcriptional regulator [Salsuginibacillus halophilus]PSL42423.1 TetR family transcriptional regulator [Salsuginibacillus halophilus]